MNHKLYNLMLGSLLLTGLYFSIDTLIYFLIAFVLLEALTGFMLASWLANFPVKALNNAIPPEFRKPKPNFFTFSADRMWRLLVGLLLIISYIFYTELWFIPWFLGFAVFGAGISGICPLLAAIRSLGLK